MQLHAIPHTHTHLNRKATHNHKHDYYEHASEVYAYLNSILVNDNSSAFTQRNGPYVKYNVINGILYKYFVE